jgi:hypothetical protein
MTISGPAIRLQVKGHDEVMEPYRSRTSGI